MRRQIPSTRSLLVFDTVARHQGVSKAAEELCLTHSAVSQQLRLLKQLLGVRLVQRSARGVTLTEAGRRYREQIADDLLRLESHTLDLMARREGEAGLLIGSVPVFAERWLIPRLPDFMAQHPQVSLHSAPGRRNAQGLRNRSEGTDDGVAARQGNRPAAAL